ncbi:MULTISPECIES: RNA polymerase sigma factor [Sphingosinicellaceae]|uniref:RNA polymerase sigma factor n=1 Tax=Sphingosinicellaceae TaxID=2820280 RepID=UPI001C1DD0F3|nr:MULTISPECIES: sigma-70 family RNA polymerase sigma factor [Polymorphobacter]QYE33129.1 sigma-70 family RNA polymerase sigma factor [Polymorphobacter sp. PAMC 29334]UAJ12378.1 sigma-70 family RNA polymerase sigma factor [Polymorphobacter megasporae]
MPIGPNLPGLSHADTTLGLEKTSDMSGGSLDVLYRRHAAWLTGVLRRTLGSFAADAEDLVQDTYVRVGRYTSDDISRHPRALLRQIAVNLARDHMRRTVVRGWPASLDSDGDDIDARLSTAATQEADVLLKKIVLGLPQTCRDVFMLSRFTSMSNDDIAAHFAISVKTVEWRLSKALALCARHLKD